MTSTKLKRRLDALTATLERHGVGSTFCECPSSDGVSARQIVASVLFPEIELIEDPVEMCDAHKPRPILKPKVSGADMLHQLFHREELIIAEEEREIMSFAQVFASLPLETRLERLGAITGANGEKQLKSSIFDRLEYQTQKRNISSVSSD